MKKKGLILITFGNFEKGKEYDFKYRNFKDLLKGGYISEVKPKKTRNKKQD